MEAICKFVDGTERPYTFRGEPTQRIRFVQRNPDYLKVIFRQDDQVFGYINEWGQLVQLDEAGNEIPRFDFRIVEYVGTNDDGVRLYQES